jgi:general secretion pathway protein J
VTGRRASAGFTLLETVVALTLLAVMLAMLFAGLRAGLRAWESGSGRGDQADQALLAYSFLRKEITSAFPWRFKDPLAVRIAFKGERDRLRFVSMRPAEVGGGGLAFVSFDVELPRGGNTTGRLTMRRTMATSEQRDFGPIEEAEKFTLLDGVSHARFEYFGAENETAQPVWSDKWDSLQRLPSHVRLELKLGERTLPTIVVALMVGEEAGCYESSFQRTCVPRR